MRAFLYARVQLVVPKALEAPRTQLHIADGVANVRVSQVALDQSQIGAALPHVIATGVPKHMGMDEQARKADSMRHAVQHKPHTTFPERSAKFGDENVVPGFSAFSFESAQGADFPPPKAMVAANAPFFPFDVKNAVIQVELRPDDLQTLVKPQAMGEQHEDERRVAMAVAVFTRAVDKLLHLAFEQMLAQSWPSLCDCSLYGDWNHVAHDRNPQVLHRVASAYYSEKAQKGNS